MAREDQAAASVLLKVEDEMIVLYIDGEPDTNFGYGVTLQQITDRLQLNVMRRPPPRLMAEWFCWRCWALRFRYRVWRIHG